MRLSTCINKGFEDGSGGPFGFPEVFRVPLNAQQEGIVRLLQSFNDAVERSAADNQARSWFTDGLVVHAVDFDPVIAFCNLG